MNKKVKETDFILTDSGKHINGILRFKTTIAFILTLFATIMATIIKYIVVDDFGKYLGEYAFLCYVAVVLGHIFVLTSLVLYGFVSTKDWLIKPKIFVLLLFCILSGYVSCLFLSEISYYFMPVYLTAYLLSPLLGKKDTFVANLIMNMFLFMSLAVECIVIGSDLLPAFIMLVIGIISGSLIAYGISDDPRKLNYLIKGTIINCTSVAVMMILTFIKTDDPLSFVDNLSYMAISTMACLIIGLLMQFILEKIFNLITNSRLVELTDHNAPLIKRLIKEAPGTFNHSISVAGFAETCATAIGENPYLARACAYYHDIGKLVNSHFFKENQGEFNPHDNMLPEVSAEIIRNHTIKGLELCKEYHIPEEIAYVTIQHHGTLPITVFYNKATKLTDSVVDIYDYSYHGVPPVTKIAAIIMICDSSEAAIRAMDAPDGERVEKLLTSLIGARISSGQFDNCGITMHELNVIKQTIIDMYGGVFHQRVKYPEGK